MSFVDHLHVEFHNSYDTTRRIVERLVGEGLPIGTGVAASPAFQRERLGDAIVHRVASTGRYDHVLPLDADEFIVADSRAALERELERTPADGVLSVAWLPYVPSDLDDPTDPNPVTRIRRRLRAQHPSMRKVFFRADMLRRDDVYVADGNHHLLSRTGRAIAEHEAKGVFLAHYPIRSAQQLASKVVIGAMARRLSPEFTDNQSRHWRALASSPGLATDLPMSELSRLAATYLGSVDAERIEMPLASEAARTMRYPDLVRVDAFERLAAFVAAVFADEALGPRGPSAGPAASATAPVAGSEYRDLLKELEEARRVMQRLQRELHAPVLARAVRAAIGLATSSMRTLAATAAAWSTGR